MIDTGLTSFIQSTALSLDELNETFRSRLPIFPGKHHSRRSHSSPSILALNSASSRSPAVFSVKLWPQRT